jgi:hypothetical protein
MRTFILCCALAFVGIKANAQEEGPVRAYNMDHSTKNQQPDSVSLKVENSNAYYQKVVKVDSTIKVSQIYLRALQFMAGKNFTQTYGYDQEGKLIFTTTQDLNVNPVNITEDNDVEQYTTQFSITIDMKNGRYRYTINNVVFFMPAPSGNRRLTLYDMYQKMTNKDSRRISKDARSVITSFERYIAALTNELHDDIEHKSLIHNSKF